ncbi:MAG: hypothetical protein M3T55_10775 [Pseudomonadota bacterium]|nr:hypothetical protein [Pseudomonadota bacterium]
MARTASASNSDTFTFRLDKGLKAALTNSAAADHKQPATLMRELVRNHLDRRERQAFEQEARRQCHLINAAACEPHSDEAKVMRELEDNLDRFADEWH